LKKMNSHYMKNNWMKCSDIWFIYIARLKKKKGIAFC
jgi:hypothetical protein